MPGQELGLGGRDLGLHLRVLPTLHGEQLTRERGQVTSTWRRASSVVTCAMPLAPAIPNSAASPRIALTSRGGLRISRSRSFTGMERRLLIGCLVRHEAHGRPAHRLAQRLGVGRVVLAALDIGLHELRGDELDLVTRGRKPHSNRAP